MPIAEFSENGFWLSCIATPPWFAIDNKLLHNEKKSYQIVFNF